MNENEKGSTNAREHFVAHPDVVIEGSPKLGDRKVLGDRVVEFDGKNWREPASGRIVA